MVRAVSPVHADEILRDLRRTHAQLKAVRKDNAHLPEGFSAWSMRLTLEEVDVLLAIVDERDDLKRRLVGDWEPGEFRDLGMVHPGPEYADPENPNLTSKIGCPRRDTIHDCPLGGCADASPRESEILRDLRRTWTGFPANIGGREARETPPRRCPGMSSALSVGGSRWCEREAGHEGACSRDGWSWAAPPRETPPTLCAGCGEAIKRFDVDGQGSPWVHVESTGSLYTVHPARPTDSPA